jgi:hypothetical protein
LGKNKTHFIPRALEYKNYITIASKNKDKKNPLSSLREDFKAARKWWGFKKNENPKKSS